MKIDSVVGEGFVLHSNQNSVGFDSSELLRRENVSAGLPLDARWRDEVEHVSHRVYSTGFYFGYPGQYTEDSRYIRQWQIAAIVEDCDANGLARCSLRNKFHAGDELEAVGPDMPHPFSFVVCAGRQPAK